MTDLTTLPAVIEPYAVTIIHEQAVRFTMPADRAPNGGDVGASWQVCPTVVTCIEEDDASIGYTAGWHSVDAAGASGGHFRLHTGSANNHSLRMTVSVGAAQTGKITYRYATSPKGGSAEVFIDGSSRGTVSFAGTAGTTFAPAFGASLAYGGLAAGSAAAVLVSK